MHIDNIIKSLDEDLAWMARRSASLNEQKSNYLKVQDLYPGAEIHKNFICLPNQENLKFMRIEPIYQVEDKHYVRHLTVKFPIKTQSPIPGMKVYAAPFRTTVATCRYSYVSGQPRKSEITVLNYPDLIPDGKSKSKFVGRIKDYLTRNIIDYKYEVSDNSFERSHFQKLMLLL